MKKYTKGFTLIELLVVIAIIGILASVVLASLSTARNKGADAAAKGAMSSLRSQAELYYGDHGNSYGPSIGSACNTAASVFASTTAIMANITGNAYAAPSCVNTSNTWAASAQLKGNTSTYFCVDSSGNATTTAAGTVTGGVCS